MPDTTRYLELGGKHPNGYFTRNRIYELRYAENAIRHIKEEFHNTDIYYCTYVFDQSERGEGTKYLSPLYFDIDGDVMTEQGYEEIRTAALSLLAFLGIELSLKLRDIQIFFSGFKGFHIIIPSSVLGIRESETLNIDYKSVVQYIQQRVENGSCMDTKIYDNKRLIRLPNSVNAKTGLYKIPVSYDIIRNMRREDLLDLAKSPQPAFPASKDKNSEAASAYQKLLAKIKETASRKKKLCQQKSLIPSEKRKLPVCVKYLLETPVAEGNRNNTAAIIASVLFQNGYSRDRAMEIMLAWNAANDPPLPVREIYSSCISTEHMAMGGRGYGCSSIRAQGMFGNSVCETCRIYKSVNARGRE